MKSNEETQETEKEKSRLAHESREKPVGRYPSEGEDRLRPSVASRQF